MPAARFTPAGEIRFGPAYFTLEVGGLPLGRRIFGQNHSWSSDGRFLAVQEWRSTAEAAGPRTALVILDIQERREWSGPIFAGFCMPRAWEGHRLRHATEAWHPSGKDVVAMETDADLIEDWRSFPPAAP